MRDVDPDKHAIVGVVRETGRQGEGWRASAPFGGRMLHKRFADRSLGSEAAALAVATAWRDAVAALDARVAPQRRGRIVEAPLGVQFRAASAKHGAAWVAKTLSADGRLRTRTFATKRRGEQKARELAEAERARMLVEEEAKIIGPEKRRRRVGIKGAPAT